MKQQEIKISFKNRDSNMAAQLQEIMAGPERETTEIPVRDRIEEQKALRRAAAWRHMFRDEPPIFMN